MNKNMTKLLLSFAVIPTLFAIGCRTVARENIVSSIETGIGLTVAENPKTELYEAKIGYIRSQFYSVPTGKVVENETHTNSTCCSDVKDKRSNRADLTPQVVSGIRMHSGIDNLILGLDVSENFAVGSTAVMSPAAVAMYVADATKTSNAGAAAAAVKSVTLADSYIKDQSGDLLREFWKPDGTTIDTNNAAKITGWMDSNGLNTNKVPITMFLRGQLHSEYRKKAVTDLKIEDNN